MPPLPKRKLSKGRRDRRRAHLALKSTNLTEVIRQNLLLAMPMYPVCRSKCKGLCPHCGQNWNEAPCDCTLEEIDPRLAVLKQLLEE